MARGLKLVRRESQDTSVMSDTAAVARQVEVALNAFDATRDKAWLTESDLHVLIDQTHETVRRALAGLGR
jgi:hypothetical protein